MISPKARNSLVTLIIGLILTLAVGVSQAQASPFLVFVREGSLWRADLNGENERLLVAQQGDTPAQFYKPYSSPDGQRVYFFSRADTALWSLNLDEVNPRILVPEEVDATYGLTFSPDGQAIGLIMRHGLDPRFQIINREGNLARTYPLPSVILGCGGGGYPPDQLLYDRQSGDQGNRLLLTWQENRVLFSTNCRSIGVSALDLTTGDVTSFDDQLNRPQISQDGHWLAGRFMANIPDAKPFGLLMVDSLTDATTQAHMDFDKRYDQWTWTEHGDLVFSVRDIRDQKPVSAANPQLLEDIFGYLPQTPIDYHLVRLYQWSPNFADLQLLYADTTLTGIPVLTTYKDAVYFSAVDDLASLTKGLEAGEDRDSILSKRPQSHIYRLPLNESSPQPTRILTNAEFPVIVVPH